MLLIPQCSSLSADNEHLRTRGGICAVCNPLSPLVGSKEMQTAQECKQSIAMFQSHNRAVDLQNRTKIRTEREVASAPQIHGLVPAACC